MAGTAALPQAEKVPDLGCPIPVTGRLSLGSLTLQSSSKEKCLRVSEKFLHPSSDPPYEKEYTHVPV